MSSRISESSVVDLIETADIGGTNANTAYTTMAHYSRARAYVEIGTWNAGDDLDECRIQQASDTSGTGVKDLTTDESGGDYDTDAPVDADGDFVIIEIRSEDMDTDNGFHVIRTRVAEGGNSGTDNVTVSELKYGYAYPRKELQGAASAGSQVYVSA